MSVSSTIKLFVLISITGLFYYVMIKGLVTAPKSEPNAPSDKPKYILNWKVTDDVSHFLYNRKIRSSVLKQNYCPLYPKCYLTEDMDLLPDLTDFDAVMMNSFLLSYESFRKLPVLRSQRQKYIFLSQESSHNYPICDSYYNGYFNWTWTFRFDSDLLWTDFVIYDLAGRAVGPKPNMSWLPTNQPINEDLKVKLRSKRKTAAWFVTHCKTKSKREKFVEEVSTELKRYNMNVDIFGRCKHLKCPKKYWYCNLMIEKDYYFYFALENSFDKDYVSEKLLNALNNLAVPVVFGAANYSNFLPPGSYLDGRALGAKLLARTMRDIIKNQTRYEDMFRWRNHYQYKESFTINMCNLCAKLYDTKEYTRVTVWQDFLTWWNADPGWCSRWNSRHENGSNIYMNLAK